MEIETEGTFFVYSEESEIDGALMVEQRFNRKEDAKKWISQQYREGGNKKFTIAQDTMIAHKDDRALFSHITQVEFDQKAEG